MAERARKLDESGKELSAPIPPQHRLLLDTQSAAELLSLSPQSLEKLPLLRVKIPGIKRTLWRRSDLEDYVRSLTG